MTDNNPEAFENVGLGEFQSLGSVLAHTVKVMAASPETGGSADVPQPSKAGGTERRGRKTGKKRKTKKGGWPARTGMEWQDVVRAKNTYHAARRARLTPNYLVVINPPVVEGESGRERRARIARGPDRIREGLKRRGQSDIAITTWEWPTDGRLHANLLIHVRPENDDFIARWHNPPEIAIRKAVPSDIDYITKERLPRGPDFEKVATHKRVKAGVRFSGKRLSISDDAEALVSFGTKRRQPVAIPEPVRAPVIWTADAKGQFQLFEEPPVLVSLDNFRGGKLPPPVAEQLEARRRQLGLTKEELALRTGISRPQISNVVAGRFGLSRDAAERLQAVLKEAA